MEMFWFKTHGFVFLQLICQLELKSVLKTDTFETDIFDEDEGDAEVNLDSFKEKDLKAKKMDKGKIDTEEREVNKLKIKAEDQSTMKPNKIKKKVNEDKNLALQNNRKQKVIKNQEKLENRDEVSNIKEYDYDSEDNPERTKNEDRLAIKNITKSRNLDSAKKVSKESSMNHKFKSYSSQSDKNDYSLDDFWEEQPFDFNNYFEFTTSKPKTKQFSMNDLKKPELMRQLKNMIDKTKVEMSSKQEEKADYALDDFWADQPIDFDHYYQFITQTPKPTTTTPQYEYYDNEYRDAYDYNREHSQNIQTKSFCSYFFHELFCECWSSDLDPKIILQLMSKNF